MSTTSVSDCACSCSSSNDISSSTLGAWLLDSPLGSREPPRSLERTRPGRGLVATVGSAHLAIIVSIKNEYLMCLANLSVSSCLLLLTFRSQHCARWPLALRPWNRTRAQSIRPGTRGHGRFCLCYDYRNRGPHTSTCIQTILTVFLLPQLLFLTY